MSRILQGRSAIITGANQGLGLAIARAFVAQGASVFLCARNAALLEQARVELAALASPDQVVAARAVDVSRRADVEQLVATALQLFPRLHILVNNAGVWAPRD